MSDDKHPLRPLSIDDLLDAIKRYPVKSYPVEMRPKVRLCPVCGYFVPVGQTVCDGCIKRYFGKSALP
jgi:hypothetical protein